MCTFHLFLFHSSSNFLLSESSIDRTMTSSPPSEDHQSKRESAPSSSDPNHQQPQPPPRPDGQPPPPGYPSAMWYTPQMGYPSGQQPVDYYNQSAYPNAPNQYAYAQAPPAGYYYQQNYGNDRRRRTEENSEVGLLSLFLSTTIFCALFFGFLCLFIWLVAEPANPLFHVESMSVTNFNTSTPFTATWDAIVSIHNHRRLKAYFDQIQCAVFYEGNELGLSYVMPFSMEMGAKTGMAVRISTNGSAEVPVPIWVTQEMEKDRTTRRSVTFSLNCFMISAVKDQWMMEKSTMKFVCRDLNIDFEPGSGSGKLAPGKKDECKVYEGRSW